MAFNQYDPFAVTVTWGAATLLGFMDGTFVEAQRDEDSFTKKTGATGDVARVKNRNRGGSVKVTLMQTSVSNAYLSGFHKLGEQLPLSTDDVMQLQVKDVLGNVLVHATNAWIKKVSNVTYAKELQGREWIFDCAVLDFDVGDAGY